MKNRRPFALLPLLLAGCAHPALRQSTSLPIDALPASIIPPQPSRTVPPKYPDAMQCAGLTGEVVVDCLVGRNGEVREAKIVESTMDDVEVPTVMAVERWRFTPGKLDGQPAEMWVRIPIRFVMPDP